MSAYFIKLLRQIGTGSI